MGIRNKERRDRRRAKMQASVAGQGMYIYQNITNSDIYLPRPTHSGRRTVGPRERFLGDDYFKCVKELMCLQEIIAPMEQKLLTEVPPTVTQQGQVEYVQEQPGQKPLHEGKPVNEDEETKDVLLVENPLEGVRILR